MSVGLPTHRAPTTQGEMLLEEFLKPLGLTQTEVAERTVAVLTGWNLDRRPVRPGGFATRVERAVARTP